MIDQTRASTLERIGPSVVATLAWFVGFANLAFVGVVLAAPFLA
jgi:hypothetical protein